MTIELQTNTAHDDDSEVWIYILYYRLHYLNPLLGIKNRLLQDLFNIINHINLFVYSRKHPVTVILYKNLFTLIFQTDVNRPDWLELDGTNAPPPHRQKESKYSINRLV